MVPYHRQSGVPRFEWRSSEELPALKKTVKRARPAIVTIKNFQAADNVHIVLYVCSLSRLVTRFSHIGARMHRLAFILGELQS